MTARSQNHSGLSRRARTLALGASLLALGASPAFAEFELTLLHLNDLHSRVEPISRFNSTCSAEDDAEGKCFGGYARLKTAIEARREALEGPTLLISAGDHFQGSLFYTTYKGEIEGEMATALGVDVMALGNHEFDDGEEELAAFLDEVTFPVLGANVGADRDSAVVGRVDPYVIAEFGEERVAFVGAVAADTGELSSPGENIDIGDDIEAVRTAVEEVKALGVNKIIAVTHIGFERDKELAAAIPEIDLIIGGHSNTFLSNTAEDADGPYPTFAADTPIVQAGAYGKYLGELTVVFDDEGEVIEAKGEPILVDASFEKDAALEERIASLAEPIETLKTMVVGEATSAIDGDRSSCRAGECQMGNLVTDAMLSRVADQGIDIAIQNGGGLRASIDSGEVTMGEVLTVLPFQNTLATFRLSGGDILASLENGVSEIEEGGGRFPQVAGMTYAFDPSKPAGERVSDVMIGGEPLDLAAMYGVVSNDFMRGGGDGYDRFREGAEDAYDYGPGLEQVLADYIAETGPVAPEVEGRITDLSKAAMEADEDMQSDEAMADEAAAEETMSEEAMAEDADASEAMVGETAAADGPAGDDGSADAVEAINEVVPDAPDALADAPMIAEETPDVLADGDGAMNEETIAEEPMTEGEEATAALGDAMADEADNAAIAINEVVPDAPDVLADAPVVEATEETAEQATGVTEIEEVQPTDEQVADMADEAMEAGEETADAAATLGEETQDAVEEAADALGAAATDVAAEASEATEAAAGEINAAVEESVTEVTDALAEAPAIVAAPEEATAAEDAPAEEMATGEAMEKPEGDEAMTDMAEGTMEAEETMTAEATGDAAMEKPEETAMADEAMAEETVVEGTADGEAMADTAMEKPDAMADGTGEAMADKPGEAMADADGTAVEDASGETVMADAGAAAGAAAEDAAMAAKEEGEDYVVKAGDTYWSIAQDAYGDPNLYPVIQEANEELANRLQVGQTITIPPKPAAN